MVAAFDFDGTLTNKDTLLGFFLYFKTSFKFFKIILYRVAMVMTKLNILSNTNFKAIGIFLFLKGKSKIEIEKMGKNYAKTIKLNNIYYQYYAKLSSPWVISASFYEYLQFIFPEQNVIASQLQYDDKAMVKGLEFNCYGDLKLTAIQKKKIDRIDIFYTDNPKTDKSIVDLAEKTFLVNNGEIVE
jgi:phosphoserine phosphatase